MATFSRVTPHTPAVWLKCDNLPSIPNNARTTTGKSYSLLLRFSDFMKYPNNRRLGQSLVVTERRRDQGSRFVCGQPAPWRLFQFNMKKQRNMLDWVMIVIATI